jgi:hypothetical protein
MATTTTRLALTKPAGSENIDVTILNANADKIDAVAGFTPVTSGTRPAAPFSGQAIRETDTGNTYVHNGGTPASAGWIQIPNAASNITLAASAQLIIGADTNLYRSAANTLKTDDDLIVVGVTNATGGLVVTGNASVSGSAAITGAATIGGTLNVVGTLSQNGKAVQLKNRIVTGTISIVPSAANTPTSGVFSYPALDGTVFRSYVSANTAVPGTTVLGVSATVPTSTSVTVYVSRTNTTSTSINVLVIGSDS